MSIPRKPASGAAVRMRGFGLVEIMVGITIGLLALLIVYQVLALSEGYRRTTMAGGDAQSSGMIATFMLAQDIGNGGHTISDSAPELAVCPNTGDFATTWRPIPVLIRDGGADDVSDSFDVFVGANRRLVTPQDIIDSYAPGGTLSVQSPLGFHPSHAGESAHMFVISDIAANMCESGVVGGAWPPAASTYPAQGYDAVTGRMTFVPTTSLANNYPQGSSWIVNLGPTDRVRKTRYDIDPPGPYAAGQSGVLRSEDLLSAAAVPNPIVSNIVLMKVQYGLDTNADSFIDTWRSARTGPWDEDGVLGANLAQLKMIKAIRVALVVRSSQFERLKDSEGRDAVGSADLASNFKTTLFPCNGLAGCTGEMKDVVIPGSANARFRVFEQIIPLTNQIWNPS